MTDPVPFVPIRGLHHFAWRCRDCEETRAFYEDLLGLPLVHVIRSDVVPSTGEHCPYVHVFFRMADGSHLAFFDLGDNVAAAPSPNTPALGQPHRAARRFDRGAARGEGAARGGRRRGARHHRPPRHRVDLLLRPERHPPRADRADGERRDDGAPRAGSARRGRGVDAREAGAPRRRGGAASARPRDAGARPPRSPTGARWMPERRERRLAAIDVKPGAAMESQSGLQMLRPRIYGAYEEPRAGRRRPRAGAPAPSSCTRRATSWATT